MKKLLPIILLGFIFCTQQAQAISTKIETLQNAVTATGNGTVSIVQGMTTSVVQVSGTFVGTISFEASLDGTTFHAIECFSIGDRAVSITTTTSTGSWRCNVSGISRFRARVSAYTSGSITVKAMFLSAGVF